MITLFFMFLLSVCLFAQAPQKMNYQAVVRNANNSLVANQNVSARISILQGSATGAAVYVENHNVQTNANGNHQFFVPNGVDGTAGPQGPQGAQGEQGIQGPAGYSPVVTITTLDTMRTQVTITSAEFPEGQSFIVKNGSAGSAFVQDQANWLETDPSSNSYIQNKPTIPAAANNATLTIQKNGTSVGTFTADASSNKTINITVPTTTSELTNNSGFITSAAVPTSVSQLNNDANYVSNTNCPTVDLCDLSNTLTALQSEVSSLRNIVNAQQSTISSQDSVINALNNQINPPFECGTYTVTDHEGNIYNTVKIGNQCWTKENMRCTTSPSTGTNILEASPSSYSYTGKKAYYVNGNASNTATYGLLYNWCAAVDTFNTAYGETSTNTNSSDAVSVTFSGNRRGICPQGWHVPSDAEWTQLTDYVSSQSQYVCGSNSTYIAKALASTTGWNTNSGACTTTAPPWAAATAIRTAGFLSVASGTKQIEN